MDELKSNSELEMGEYYHCFDKNSGRHSIHQCMIDAYTPKYLGVNRIWADDDNNQALTRWRIFGPIVPPNLETIYLCAKHNGHGFQSDCAICKAEV